MRHRFTKEITTSRPYQSLGKLLQARDYKMATIATGSKTEISYVPEVTYGVTPPTPAFQKICYTGTTLGITKDTIESTCLTSDRQVKEVRTGNRQTAGDLNAELSYDAYDVLIEAALMGTWTADVLKAGSISRSFTIEKYFDLDVDEYHRFTGCLVNTWSVNVAPNQMVTSNFGLIGKDIDDQNLTSQVAGATYSPEVLNPPFDSFTGTIEEGGAPIATVTEIDITLDNTAEVNYVLMSKTTIQFLTEASSSLKFTLTDQDGNDLEVNIPNLKYTSGNDLEVNIPNLKYTSGNPDVSAEGPVTVALAFTAIYDAVELSQIVLTRTVAP
jgi:hypothetical protein